MKRSEMQSFSAYKKARCIPTCFFWSFFLALSKIEIAVEGAT